MTRPFLLQLKVSYPDVATKLDITDIHLYPPHDLHVFLVRYPGEDLKSFSPRRYSAEFIIRNIGIEAKIKEML